MPIELDWVGILREILHVLRPLWPLAALVVVVELLKLFGPVLLHRRRNRLARSLRDMSPEGFEHFCRDLVSAMGYRARTTRYLADGGVDVFAEDGNGEQVVVQCKRWTGRVGVRIVRELLGVVAIQETREGWLVTTSDFTPQAYKEAEGQPLRLINGSALRKLVTEYLPRYFVRLGPEPHVAPPVEVGADRDPGILRGEVELFPSQSAARAGARPEWPIVCEACGREATVPFKPRGDGPLYCRDCYRRLAAGARR